MILATLGLFLASAAAAQEPRAADLAGRLGCFACHALRGQGGKVAAPLDGAATRLNPEQLETVLTHPRRLHPGAKMPGYAYLPPEERQALVDFLQDVK